ncbi:hypothetical protein S7711_01908 [Stachybotrys chartarum IBT 7711]|uniref:Uncharacterized protein n=1 Tax=Stachybotrys chartarum (strain CBS 109288 / IBT 7711) TaxID=1280523 RepID=A0A084AMT5_STACB|nr:hypothetical protein S7711_01908 [Stachybotrys chartarum IBT 7711]
MAAEPTVNTVADVPSASPELQVVSFESPAPVQLHCLRHPYTPYPHVYFADSICAPKQVNDSTHDAQDGLPVNGNAHVDDIENKHITSVEDQLNSTDVSVSGGSDTEASRHKDDDKGHGRTGSSVKKPTFKAVSVNKTFLAAKGNAANASSKTNEKPLSGSSTPPPGAAALTASRPRLVAKTGSGTRENAPKFSSINGRKPAAAPDPNVVWNKNRPPPVQEPKKLTDEELKKYGIHMASRLNEDDAQGQNKWADIDDDDDDWAPEAITWGDGTKTTLPHPDEHPPPPSDSGSVVSKDKVERLPDKPVSPAPPAVPTIQPQKLSSMSSGKGLVLKSGSQDKPTLVAKPPAPPTPAKSPWATLPPVEKASPVPNEAPGFSRISSRDPAIPKGMTPPPPKEIAADDFSRSTWRDGSSYGNRELYNSQSGRYEPVSDRRGSMRSDSQAKHPSVLLRSTPPDQPAELPSASQAHRTGSDLPAGRRRGSSNVSGGSGSYLQRFGKGNDVPIPPPEILGARRPSLAGSVESPISPANLVPSIPGQARQPNPAAWAPRSSPRANSASLHQPAAPTDSNAGQPSVDDVEYQKKLMRERIELARKRRQEEEAREEAAKRERIQRRLEALGPAPEKKSDRKDASSKESNAKPVQIQQRGEPEPNAAQSSDTDVRHDSANAEAGKQSEKSLATSPNQSQPSASTSRPLSHDGEGKPPNIWGGPGPRPERFASWNQAAPPLPQARNVWGSPDNDRGLGNGTFNPDLSRIPGSSVASTQASQGPSPIAPPTSKRPPSQDRPQPQPPIGSRASRYNAPVSDMASKWVAAVVENDQKISADKLAERNSRERQLAERGMKIEDAQPTIKETWRPVHLPGDGTRRPIASGEVQSHHPAPWSASQEEVTKVAASHEGSTAGNPAGVIGAGSSSILSQPSSTTTSQSRPSRFFPAKDVRLESSNVGEPSRPNSPSPPPPTMEGHPAYEGDAMHPHVSLPRPQPIVKLPPSINSPPTTYRRVSPTWNAASSQKEGSSRPAVPVQPVASARASEGGQGNWQSRIDNLLNGSKTSPPKSMRVDPASKSALEHANSRVSATVSLPTSTSDGAQVGQRPSWSKPMAEECFEEQEMGSLPRIKLPLNAPEALWNPAQAPTKLLPRKLLMHASIMEPYHFNAELVGGGNAMKILFPGMEQARIITVPFSATRSSRPSQSRGGSRSRGSGHAPRGAKREPSSSFPERGTSNGSGRGNRGSFRSRGSDSWTRHTPAPSSTAA